MDGKVRDCPDCHGEGKFLIRLSVPVTGTAITKVYEDCATCLGSGKVFMIPVVRTGGD